MPKYVPASAFTVSLDCHVDPESPSAFTVVVDDAYPAGWTVVPGSISDDGVEIAGTVKWFFLMEEDRTLTYSVLPPPSDSGTKLFSGTIFSDGDAGPMHMPIGGDQSIDDAAMKLYWTDIGAGQIRRSDLDGSDIETLVARMLRDRKTVSDSRGPQGVAIHAESAKMFWIDLDPDRPELEKLQRANLDGSNIEDVITTETFGTRDLVIAFGMLYWYNLYTGEIRRANIDGTGIETVRFVLPDEEGWHVGLAADSERLYIALGRRIISTDPDGDSPLHIIDLGKRSRVRGVAVDEAAGKLYWADGGDDAVRRSDLSGFSVETLAEGVLNPQRVAVDPDGGKVYWTDSGPRYAGGARIMRSDPDGSNAETIVGTLDLPQAIAIGPDLPPFPLPLPPTELEATPVSPFQIDLSWNDESDDEDGFEVERALDPEGPFAPIIPAPPNSTPTAEYEDLALEPVTEYCYRVRAFSAVGKSGWSNVACATTLGLATAPPATTTTAPPITTTTAPASATTAPPPAATTTAPPAEADMSVWGDPCDCDAAPSICDPAPGRMTFQLSVATDGSGRTIPETGLTTRPRGSLVRLTALPAPGSRFLLWRVSEPAHSFFSEVPDIANSPDPSVVLSVRDDIDVTAVFIDA